MNARNLLPGLFAALAFLFTGLANAVVVSVGSQITIVPSYFGSTTLGTDQFLVPIKVSSAAGLEQWQFDFSFDSSVVTQIEPFFTPYSFGLYAARFDPTDPNSLSSPTSAGFSLVPGLIEQIAGFSQAVNGDGTLIFLAFEYLQSDKNPNFALSNVTTAQPLPEPSTVVLLAAGLVGLAFCRRKSKAREPDQAAIPA